VRPEHERLTARADSRATKWRLLFRKRGRPVRLRNSRARARALGYPSDSSMDDEDSNEVEAEDPNGYN
jgi:hypothetical protein